MRLSNIYYHISLEDTSFKKVARSTVALFYTCLIR